MSYELYKDVTDFHDDYLVKRKIFEKTRTLIWVAASIMVLLFGVLELRNIPLNFTVFNQDVAKVMFKISLILYFWGWAHGTIFDLSDEEQVLVVAPNRGELTRTGILLIILLAAVFCALCMFQTPIGISITLSFFFILDYIGWRYLINFTKKSINESRSKYEKYEMLIGNTYLDILENYISGDWKRVKYVVMFVFLVLINILVYTSLSMRINQFIGLPFQDFYLYFTILLYVLVSESCQWYMRIKRRWLLKLVDEIYKNYSISRKDVSLAENVNK